MSKTSPAAQSHELFEYQLLQHLEQNSMATRREMASVLGVSMKLAQDMATAIIRKGYLHVVRHNPRKWEYFLTPAGLAAKAQLTVQFVQFSMQFYREARKHSAQVCRTIAEEGGRQIAFLGSGDLAEITYLGVQEWGLQLAAVYDAVRKPTTFLHLPVQPLAAVADDTTDAIVVCLYDAAHPMNGNYLPKGVAFKPTMRWIFSTSLQMPATEPAARHHDA
jgi:DNA-binding MarR family transcriptional regulator